MPRPQRAKHRGPDEQERRGPTDTGSTAGSSKARDGGGEEAPQKKHEAPQMPTIPSALLTIEEIEHLGEDYTFYVFRTDTNAVLAKGIQGFEAAKARASQLRKSHGLKWDQVKFKAERGTQAGAAGGSSGTAPNKQFGSVGMERPSPMLLGRPVECSMPVTTTHQKGADLGGIRTLRATITILIKYAKIDSDAHLRYNNMVFIRQ